MRRTLPALALAAALAVLTSCGGDESSGSSGSSSADSPADGGSGSSELVDVCSLVSAEDVGEVLGATVTTTEVPGGGCSFNQEDPRAVSASIVATPYDEGSGGMDGTRQGVTGVLDGATAETLGGVGDDAFVAVGTALGGENQQGGGAVLVGGTTVQVSVLQAEDLPADDVRQLTVDLLTLVGERA
ncbi:hypothetical protein [Nocardioides lianchengensis]|uniref:DUF3558 domain-containing protein n=1 Tax=Nocardioides lianchengensis TaxID=1045774 RepID=A0A1G6X5Y8_9ACTN|nr:hypothetical protein [Nocardioides lianchengensis]NYG09084.1 hypothetical protein [Nocardioides lianchengensis]SDD73538.1 hypothetical protein SAMN05421872_110174 [Nocardioides lianchengensis]